MISQPLETSHFSPEKPVFATPNVPSPDADTINHSRPGSPSAHHDLPAEIANGQSGTPEKLAGAPEETRNDPPLPSELPPPLPNEAPPGTAEDDGWTAMWDNENQAFYFFNKLTKTSQWENPRVPQASQPPPPGTTGGTKSDLKSTSTSVQKTGGYDPAIHGDYDPNADYAKSYEAQRNELDGNNEPGADPDGQYAATGAFNRFTGRWQREDLGPERFSDENKSRRQMNAFFDVDAAANSHEGKSLKAERQNRKLSKKELKDFKEKRREKKEEKRRAWLRD